MFLSVRLDVVCRIELHAMPDDPFRQLILINPIVARGVGLA